MPPCISIIIPTKNRAHLLPATLDSLTAQTFPHWEALIVDDHSSDPTPALLHHRAAADPRFRYLPPAPPPGAPACRNRGLHAARAPFVLFLDSDDLLRPTALETRLHALQALPHADAVVANGQLFHHLPGDTPTFWNTFTPEHPLDRFLRADAVWSTNGPLWRRRPLLELGGWHEGLARWQDWELHTRALCRNLHFHCLPLADHFVRRSTGNTISARDGDLAGLFDRFRAIAALFPTLRASPLHTPHRSRLLATLAYDQFIALCHLQPLSPRALAAWLRISRARGFHPADLPFALLGALHTRLAPNSYLPLRLYRRYHRIPLTPSTHCNTTTLDTGFPTTPPNPPPVNSPPPALTHAPTAPFPFLPSTLPANSLR